MLEVGPWSVSHEVIQQTCEKRYCGKRDNFFAFTQNAVSGRKLTLHISFEWLMTPFIQSDWAWAILEKMREIRFQTHPNRLGDETIVKGICRNKYSRVLNTKPWLAFQIFLYSSFKKHVSFSIHFKLRPFQTYSEMNYVMFVIVMWQNMKKVKDVDILHDTLVFLQKKKLSQIDTYK